jgi:hypothetical protein
VQKSADLPKMTVKVLNVYVLKADKGGCGINQMIIQG